MATLLQAIRRPAALFACACLCLSVDILVGGQSLRGSSAEEVFVGLPNGGKVALSTRGPSSFRVRFLYWGEDAKPIDSPMVGPREPDAPFSEIKSKGTGIKTTFGSILVTHSGSLELYTSDEKLLTKSANLLSSSKSVGLTSANGLLYGRGAAPNDCLSLNSNRPVRPLVCNRGTYAPYYFTTDGYSALGVTSHSIPESPTYLPIEYSTSGSAITWDFGLADDFELFLMPASTLLHGTQASYDLTGTPAVPPRYAFGFIASRWGWEDRAYVEEIIGNFRDGEYPIDAIIIDFRWFTNVSDYNFEPAGRSYYQDFGYHILTFPEPEEQFADYHNKNIKVGGIRKPRLGNKDLLKDAGEKGWLFSHGEPGGIFPPKWEDAYAVGRNVNFSNPEARAWYAQKTSHFFEEGMSFWWNDEGETDVFTYHWWNVAEQDSLQLVDASRRFYSINRGWTPGMARMGTAVWTGDITATWEDLQRTPGMMLNWVLGGAPYVACDIGGFFGATTPELMARWYQVGTFMPVMRVHSHIARTPRFPFLFGEEAGAVMKAALNLRYRLVPYHYSLAHAMFAGSDMWIKPLVIEYPLDSNVNNSVSQWFDGNILVAPVLSSDSRQSVYLPEGIWYPLAASPSTRGSGVIAGPTSLDGVVDLSVVPAFVQSGTVLPLAPVVQSTEDLPGGALEVQVYAGADGKFTLVEDDGSTLSYQAGNVRKTSFVWNDEKKTLSWTVSGSATPAHRFTEVTATLVTSEGWSSSEVVTLEGPGSITFENEIIAIVP